MEQNQFQTDAAALRKTAGTAAADETQEIDLLLLFNALRKHILAIIASALVFALVAGIVVQFFITPRYEATTSTYLVSVSGGSLMDIVDLQISQNIAPDYVDIIKSRSILGEIINLMDLDYEYDELYNNVEVTNPTDTHIIKITVTDTNPVLAMQIANNLTEYAVERISEIMEVSTPNTYDDAIIAEEPSFPSLTKTVVIAFVLGAVIACGVIVFIAVMDTTVKTPEDIENRCGLVTLTKV